MLKTVLNRLASGLLGARSATAPAAPLPRTASGGIDRAIQEYRASNFEEARALAQEIVGHDPDQHQAWNLLGAIALERDDHESASMHFERAVALQPGNVEFLSNCGEAFRRAGRLDDAEDYCRAAVAAGPKHAPAQYNLAVVLAAQADVEGAYAAYRSALEVRPTFLSARSGLLFLLCHHPDVGPETILAEHRRWEEIHACGLAPQTPPAVHARLGGPLRVGFVSADFRRHALAYFIEPVFARHDRSHFEFHVYNNGTKTDEVTARLRGHVAHWRDIAALTDDAVARQIAEDGIDILIDLSGHTAGGRLPLFARKPAPVQASYVGYLNTTGLSAMDFRITDVCADPPGVADAFYAERLARLPHSQWCYRPPEDTPGVNPLPAAAHGAVTFGSTHNFTKLNASLTALWARLLARIPNARLMIVGVPGENCTQRLREQLAAEDVDPARLELVGKCNFDEYLRQYHRMDILLDAFPYNGATTTCESLWMGVPVITLAGRYAAARSGTSLLTSLGHSELIASTPEQYIDIAACLAGDLPRLAALRASLRETMRRSPLMDEAGFTRAFEALLQDMVRRKEAGH